jgi:hypothetical protein
MLCFSRFSFPNFVKSIALVNCVKCFIYLFPNWHLFTGQLSCLEIWPMGRSLLSCGMVQLKIRWSTVWLPPPQGQSGDSVILKRCRYDVVLPRDVTNAVKFGVKFILVSNLSFMFGKNSFVVRVFVVSPPYICHFFRLVSLSC